MTYSSALLVALSFFTALGGCAPLPPGLSGGPSTDGRPEVDGGGSGLLGGLSVTAAERNYLVRGAMFGEVIQQMARLGPVVGGRHVQASTDWSLTWAFDVAQEGEICRLRDVRVVLDLVTTLPRWLDVDHAITRGARRQWEAFLRDLRAHETGHEDIARDGATRLLVALIVMEDAQCGTLSSRAQGIASQHRASLERSQRAFDEGRVAGPPWVLPSDIEILLRLESTSPV